MTDILSDLLTSDEVEEKVPDGPIMDFRIEKAVLDKALSEVLSVVPNRDLIPVLKNFHLRLSGLDLLVTGSDKTVSALRHADVLTASVHGSAVFPATKFLNIVKEAPDTLHIRVMSKQEKSGKQTQHKITATIKSGQTSWVLPLMDSKNFPDFDGAEEYGTVEVDREPLLHGLQRVRKSMSSDTMRPYLMLIDVSKGRMRASDSIRFQQIKFDFPFDCQIPHRAVGEVISRLSSSNSEKIEVGQSNHALLFRFGGTLLICQKTVAQFPSVDEVLLKPAMLNDLELKVDRSLLLKAVRRVRITADEDTAAVVLSLNHGSVSVEAKDRKGGVSLESVDAEWEHAPRHVSFNHQHLSDMLSSTSSETCVFRLGKDLKTRPTPLLMEDEEEGFTAVLSQIRLDWL